MFFNRCSCIGNMIGGGGDGGPVPKACPDHCLSAGSIIYPYEDKKLVCGIPFVLDLADITNSGDCANYTYTVVSGYDTDLFDISIVGSELSITLIGDTTAYPAWDSQFIEIRYLLSCTDDIRKVLVSLKFYIEESDLCEI